MPQPWGWFIVSDSMTGIQWGAFSITLLIGSLQGVLIGGLLLSAKAHRAANRALALLIWGVVLRITPYTLGFAGYYDRYKWLNFAPFYWDLAFGPLIWLYVRQLGRRDLPARWVWHFLPVALQVGYFCLVCALVSSPLRDGYNDRFHVVWIVPLFATARLASYVGYAMVTVRSFSLYQQWLANHSGLREEFRLTWLKVILSLAALVLVVDALVSLFEAWVHPIAYGAEFPLYLVFAVLVWLLGLEGWRHAARTYPIMDEPAAEAVPADSSHAPDWGSLGPQWLAEIDARGWWREPDISLAVIARRLGTNTAYLSRAFNAGTGRGFSEAINGLRVAEAKRQLAQPGSVLEIAGDVGFASKASFNRVFKALVGETPTAFRQHIAAATSQNEKIEATTRF